MRLRSHSCPADVSAVTALVSTVLVSYYPLSLSLLSLEVIQFGTGTCLALVNAHPFTGWVPNMKTIEHQPGGDTIGSKLNQGSLLSLTVVSLSLATN